MSSLYGLGLSYHRRMGEGASIDGILEGRGVYITWHHKKGFACPL